MRSQGASENRRSFCFWLLEAEAVFPPSKIAPDHEAAAAARWTRLKLCGFSSVFILWLGPAVRSRKQKTMRQKNAYKSDPILLLSSPSLSLSSVNGDSVGPCLIKHCWAGDKERASEVLQRRADTSEIQFDLMWLAEDKNSHGRLMRGLIC